MPDTTRKDVVTLRFTSSGDDTFWLETTDVLSAKIDTDMYAAGDTFEIGLPSSIKISAASRCQLYVNGQLEMNGIVDRVVRGYNKKSGYTTVVEGRDLMGILVDSYCEEYLDIEGWSIRGVAERLLRRVPYIKRKEIVYSGGADKLDASRAFTHIDPGSRICETLQRIALSRGILFYTRPDGTLVFGVPKFKGKNRFSIINKTGINQSLIYDCEYIEDTSSRYSKITAITQTQDDDTVNVTAVKLDDRYPFYKPYVHVVDEDEASPGKIVTMVLNKQRFDGTSLRYRVSGFSQNSRNWTTDEICFVDDDRLPFRNNMLIHRRVFALSRTDGSTTELYLGYPGVAK